MVSTHQPGISPRVQNKWAANYRQLLTRSIALFYFLDNFFPSTCRCLPATSFPGKSSSDKFGADSSPVRSANSRYSIIVLIINLRKIFKSQLSTKTGRRLTIATALKIVLRYLSLCLRRKQD
ncbi:MULTISPECIES: hypothetical protein [unclassified Microcoleus]|uniref:hypothetical protein n=1 Tax=unclassified Microcoleus TaxID=2642155 RepID=UPI002FD32D36